MLGPCQSEYPIIGASRVKWKDHAFLFFVYNQVDKYLPRFMMVRVYLAANGFQ